MSNLSSNQYWAEVQSLAASIVADAADYTGCNTADTFDRDTITDHIYDSLLNETIDGHQWVIYYAYNLDVLKHSDNAEYMIDELGTDYAGQVLKDKGLSGLHTACAYWALYADVNDRLSDVLDEFEESFDA